MGLSKSLSMIATVLILQGCKPAATEPTESQPKMLAETAMLTIATLGAIEVVIHKWAINHVTRHLRADPGKRVHSVFAMNSGYKLLVNLGNFQQGSAHSAAQVFFKELLGKVAFNPNGQAEYHHVVDHGRVIGANGETRSVLVLHRVDGNPNKYSITTAFPTGGRRILSMPPSTREPTNRPEFH